MKDVSTTRALRTANAFKKVKIRLRPLDGFGEGEEGNGGRGTIKGLEEKGTDGRRGDGKGRSPKQQ